MVKKNISSGDLIYSILIAVFLFSATVFSQDDYSQWSYSTRVNINTTGAGISGSVSNFPLLVRLTSSNFEFSLAKTNGEDIRFSTSSINAHLSYEIERWDGAGEEADIWVRVSSILANNNSQYIMMYFGNAGATDSSSSEDVFRTGNDFAGVWHLAQSDYSDATSNNNDATGYSASEGTGVIGSCKDFNGSTNYITCGSGSSLDNIGSLTIEAWIRPDGWGGNSYGRIVDKANANLDGLSYFVQDNITYGYQTFAFMRDPDAANPDSAYVRGAQYSLSLSSWYHVVMCFSGGVSRLYVNGSEPTPYFMQSTMPGGSSMFSDASFNLTIGNNSDRSVNARPFNGRIDEVRVSDAVRTADEIKLNYETQKSNQTIVTVDPVVVPATITVEPTNDTAQLGGSASFSVTVSGTAPISYQWDDSLSGSWSTISGATSSTHTINLVAAADSGSYRVRVWNSAGGDTSETVKLYIFDPPVITVHPVSKAVAVSEVATFTVVATGSLLTYQWQVMAPGGSWHDSSGATLTGLTTVPATTAMNGTQYRCIVSGIVGTPVTSNSATLIVGQSIHPKIITDLDSLYEIPAGDTAALQVVAIGLAPLYYQWDKFITSTWNPLAGETTDTYTINGMNSSFEGLYRVRVWNDSGADISTVARVALIGTVPNIIKIDTSWFDEVTNYVVVNWHIDISQAPPQSVFKSAYTYNRGTVLNTDSIFYAIDTVTSNTNTTFIYISDLYWDTTYTIGLWLGYETVNGNSRWTRPTDSSTCRNGIPSFTWQIVTFFPNVGQNGEVVTAANGKIVLREINNFPGPEHDTLRAYHPYVPFLPKGLVLIDAQPFRFCRSNYTIPDFVLELPYSNLPLGISASDVGLYRDVNGKIEVVYGFSVDEVNKVVSAPIGNNDLTGHPFLVLADTTAPVIAVGPHVEQVDTGADVSTNFTVMDNVSNVRCLFLYGRGDKGYEYSVADTLSSDTAGYEGIILNSTGAVSSLYGVRALLVVSDGVNSYTANVSRCVKSPAIETFVIPQMEWVPLRAAATLNDSSLENIFILNSPDWTYDKTKIRLFRYYNPDPATANSYMEYTDSNRENFNLIPGRLIWCKARVWQALGFGASATTTLRTWYAIKLKANTWTDFCLPFRFAIRLKDVLAATGMGSDSLLDFYHWIDDGSTSYTAIKMRIGLIDINKSIEDTLISKQLADGYTVKNNSSNDITLQIPPISLPLSPVYQPERGRQGDDMWDISFLWKEKDKHTIYREIVCAYNKNIGNKTIYGSLPPSMDRKVTIGILDSVNNSIHGYAISNSAEKGGMFFRVAFHNTSETGTRIEFRLDNLDALPEGYLAGVLNPSTRLYESTDDNPVTELALLPGTGSVTERLVVVGTDEYLNDVLQWISPATFAFLKAYPNPFNGTINLHYTLPPDIRELNITLYDVLGRTIWKTVKRRGINAGAHVFTFNSRTGLDNGSGVLPAGVYILRLSARNKSGKLIFGGEKRITCIK